jgi:hypothetical protein
MLLPSAWAQPQREQLLENFIPSCALVKFVVTIIQFLQVSKVDVYDPVGRYIWKDRRVWSMRFSSGRIDEQCAL